MDLIEFAIHTTLRFKKSPEAMFAISAIDQELTPYNGIVAGNDYGDEYVCQVQVPKQILRDDQIETIKRELRYCAPHLVAPAIVQIESDTERRVETLGGDAQTQRALVEQQVRQAAEIIAAVGAQKPAVYQRLLQAVLALEGHQRTLVIGHYTDGTQDQGRFPIDGNPQEATQRLQDYLGRLENSERAEARPGLPDSPEFVVDMAWTLEDFLDYLVLLSKTAVVFPAKTEAAA